MRTWSVHLPTADNEGVSLVAECGVILGEILGGWGGYTSVTGQGAWCDGNGATFHDEIRIVTVAGDEPTWDTLVRWGRFLRQRAIYYTGHTGEVYIIDCT